MTQNYCRSLISGVASAIVLWAVIPVCAIAATSELAADPLIDVAPCLAAAKEDDADKTIEKCGLVIDQEKTAKTDRVSALLARAGAYARDNQLNRAIADYGAALNIDPAQADVFNSRGELWRRKGDRPRALQDFAAAIKLNPQHSAARGNYKLLAQELERIGAAMAVNNKPSFNCATAKRAVERAICANPALANLDREINAVNSRVVSEAARDSARSSGVLQAEQDAFITQRNAAFGQPGYDLQKAMQERLQKLLGTDGY